MPQPSDWSNPFPLVSEVVQWHVAFAAGTMFLLVTLDFPFLIFYAFDHPTSFFLDAGPLTCSF